MLSVSYTGGTMEEWKNTINIQYFNFYLSRPVIDYILFYFINFIIVFNYYYNDPCKL